MNFIVEGADNSGKTTLIKYLAATTGLTYVPGEGPPKSEEEINERVAKYLQMDYVIFDRHPCVSNSIYDGYREEKMPVRPELINAFYATNPIFIYCVSDGDLSTHEIKDHDTEDHQKLVNRHALAIAGDYSAWAFEHANWLYRKGRTDMGNIAFMIRRIVESNQYLLPFDPVADVAAFHEKFDLPLQRPVVGMLPPDLADFRYNFMREELEEYSEAGDELTLMKAISRLGEFFDRQKGQEEYTSLLEKQLDALVDLVYVAIGTALFHGFDFRSAWRRVQAANMAKVRAQKDGSDSKRGSSFDVVKPKGWQPPTHIDLVANNDFDEAMK